MYYSYHPTERGHPRPGLWPVRVLPLCVLQGQHRYGGAGQGLRSPAVPNIAYIQPHKIHFNTKPINLKSAEPFADI